MKKIVQIIIIYLLTSNLLYPQTYIEQQDLLFEHLNKGNIPTGVLYDRVFPWSELTIPHEEEIHVSYSISKQVWLELELATYDKGNILSLKDAQTKVFQNKETGKGMSVGYIDYDFNSIDTTAYERGALVLGEDSSLYEGVGELYLTHNITLPFVSTEPLYGENISLYFDPTLHLTNTDRQVEKIEIDFGGNSLTLFPGQEGNISINHLTDSIINVIFKIYHVENPIANEFTVEWQNGNVMPMNLSFNSNVCYKNDTLWSGSSLVFQGYDETSPSQGRGDYRIFYRQINDSWDYCADNLQKPIVIIDGFDPGDERKITSEFGEPSIWDLLKYGNNKHLGDDLRKRGYDVIVLNFPNYEIGSIDIPFPPYSIPIYRDGGADYIERNAMVLVKLIQEVNHSLSISGSSEEIVVIGPSMGGQIARYALAYMEKQESLAVANMDHNTRLYVSFDSPHLGANIPIAAQQALYHLGVLTNQEQALKSYESQIRSVAARQMLIEQIGGLNKTTLFFQNYYNDLYNNGLPNSSGWPLNLRKISLINGTADGSLTHSANARIMYLKANAAMVMKGIELNLYNMPNTGNSLTTYDGMIRETGWGYLGSGSWSYPLLFVNNPFMWGEQKTSYTGLIFGVVTYRGTIDLINQNTNGNMDIVQGGTYKTMEVFQNQFNDFLNSEWYITQKSIEWKDVKRYHSFIPSVSALGFKNPNFNWANNIGIQDLVCYDKIPFDNYFTAETNEEHIHISEKAAEWILEEIEKGQINCPTICFTTSMYYENDLSPICVNISRTFRHNYVLPPGVTTTWNIDLPHALDILHSDNEQITVQGVDDYGDITISYNINNPCGADIKGSFTVKVGAPFGSLRLYSVNEHTNAAKIENFDTVNNYYTWSTDGANWYLDNAPHFPMQIPVIPYYDPNLFWLYLKIENKCGAWIDSVYPHLTAAPLSAQINLPSISISPNPTTNDWTITILDSELRKLQLYNASGTLIWEKDQVDFSAIIPATHLSSGMYILRVNAKEESQSFKLLKQ